MLRGSGPFHAAYCWNDGRFSVFEGGQRKCFFEQYAPGDRIEVVRNPQGKIEYVVNGEVRYTSQQVPAYALHPKVIAYHPGIFVKDVEWIREAARR